MDDAKTHTRIEELSRAALQNVDEALYRVTLIESGHYGKYQNVYLCQSSANVLTQINPLPKCLIICIEKNF